MLGSSKCAPGIRNFRHRDDGKASWVSVDVEVVDGRKLALSISDGCGSCVTGASATGFTSVLFRRRDDMLGRTRLLKDVVRDRSDPPALFFPSPGARALDPLHRCFQRAPRFLENLRFDSWESILDVRPKAHKMASFNKHEERHTLPLNPVMATRTSPLCAREGRGGRGATFSACDPPRLVPDGRAPPTAEAPYAHALVETERAIAHGLKYTTYRAKWKRLPLLQLEIPPHYGQRALVNISPWTWVL